MTNPILVETTVNTSLDTAWQVWTSPSQITNWYYASPEWCCIAAVNNVEVGGKFNWRMEARDKSMGFDFIGFYTEVKPKELLQFELSDGRKVRVEFTLINELQTQIQEYFEPETTNPVEMQKAGWQAIINQFKSYIESL